MTTQSDPLPADATTSVTTPTATLTAHELRLLLELATLQISAALRDADASAGPMSQALAAFADKAAGSEEAQIALQQLQFFDKLSQRLTHVLQALEIPLAQLANAPREHSANWTDVVARVRAGYTTADERVLLDLHFRGLGRKVMFQALQAMQESSRGGELDLF